MNRTVIGLIFMVFGLAYGSLAVDCVYNATLGYLVGHSWIKPPAAAKFEKSFLGKKTTILFYALCLIIIGVYITWNRNL